MVVDELNNLNSDDYSILRNVAEDLKTPLLRIVSQLQLNQSLGKGNIHEIEIIASATLRLLDSFIVSTQVYTGQQQLKLEPVSPYVVMKDCNQYLRDLANLHGYETEFKLQKGVGLIMADVIILKAAITSLIYSFLYNANSNRILTNQKILFTLRKSKQTIEAGVFSQGFEMTNKSLNKVRDLKGIARQLASDLSHGSGAGIVIADQLLSSMNTRLRPVRVNRLNGLVVNLMPSKQLSLL